MTKIFAHNLYTVFVMLSINIGTLGTFSFIIAQNIDVFDGKIGEVTPFLGYFRISGQLWDLGKLPCVFSQPLVPEERKMKVVERSRDFRAFQLQ